AAIRSSTRSDRLSPPRAAVGRRNRANGSQRGGRRIAVQGPEPGGSRRRASGLRGGRRGAGGRGGPNPAGESQRIWVKAASLRRGCQEDLGIPVGPELRGAGILWCKPE